MHFCVVLLSVLAFFKKNISCCCVLIWKEKRSQIKSSSGWMHFTPMLLELGVSQNRVFHKPFCQRLGRGKNFETTTQQVPSTKNNPVGTGLQLFFSKGMGFLGSVKQQQLNCCELQPGKEATKADVQLGLFLNQEQHGGALQTSNK